MITARAEPDLANLLGGDRAALARAITLIESKRPDDRAAARRLLDAVMPRTGRAIRVGITGVPGVGKSTLIDTLGSNLTADGLKVAVLAVDPSSTRTGGAITLIESKRPDDRAAARRLLDAVMPRTGRAIRVGITGVPGVGKSTLIDTLGSNLTADGLKVAVLAVDPSSTRTGGAILGDKTRMARLAADPNAFIRPSPSSGTLGGVAAKTRETMRLCEAAGFDVILVETMGVGQAETAVADLTDFFLVLMLPGAGDELQGLKKGIVELADLIAVNKADGDGAERARAAAAEYRAALHILAPASATWSPPVITVSGLANQGLDELWQAILQHRGKLGAAGELEAKRRAQDAKWMWALVEARMHARLTGDAATRMRVSALEREVTDGALSPTVAADEIAALLGL